ncbi:hypothetical protein [Dehalogenimonas etheniformans]|uniref:hypothetical protein n=1 Tax=Dehalogenimonas etheniformans TaxID=1536648 RepID=UPI0013923FD7|nr:hypothetical protein [Dehalogenimonas etheniformans]QNT75208.1 hypothetical protein HX448_00120 [Dehalogenimonas etheniformans]
MPSKKDVSVPVQAASEKRIPVKGEKLTCETCGLGVVIDYVSCSMSFEGPICCGKPMKLEPYLQKKSAASSKTRGRQAGSPRY